MSLNDLFQKIFLINLERRPDRLALSRFYLDHLHLKYTVIKAVDGKELLPEFRTLQEKNKKNQRSDRLCGLTSPGALGLLKTWQRIIRQSKKQGIQRILILEDDIIPIKNFKEHVGELFDKISDSLADYEVLYLGSNKLRWDISEITFAEKKRYFVPSHDLIYGTFALALNDKRGIFDRILDRIEGYLGGIDTYVLNGLRLEDRSNTKESWFALQPNIFIADVSDSDNMNPREFESFAESRRWDFILYDRLSLKTFCELHAITYTSKLNLRHLLAGPELELYDIPIREMQIFISDSDKMADFCSYLTKMQQFLREYRNLELTNTRGIHKYDLYNLLGPNFQSHKNFVFIIPCFNDAKWLDKCLSSIAEQEYPHYRVILIDDASTDDTLALLEKWFLQHVNMRDRCRLIKIPMGSNQGPGSSRFMGYHQCDDDEIAVFLDGDDWLSHNRVLNILNDAYKDDGIYVTYGSYSVWDGNAIIMGSSGKEGFSEKILTTCGYRKPDSPWISVHLRTAYVKLLKEIKLDDLFDETGKFYRISTDRAEMFPLLEMTSSGDLSVKHRNIQDVLYIYNKENSMQHDTSYYNKDPKNPWNDYRINAKNRISNSKIYEPVDLPSWSSSRNHNMKMVPVLRLSLRPSLRPSLRLSLRLTNQNNEDIIIEKARWKKELKELKELQMVQETYILSDDPDLEMTSETVKFLASILLEYQGVRSFLFLIDPFISKSSCNLLTTITFKNFAIIAGHIKYLNPALSESLPGIHLNNDAPIVLAFSSRE